MMNEESKDVKSPSLNFMDEKLFKSRSISIFGQINEKVARSVTEQLLALSVESEDPITIYISSPGGHVESGDVIYDMISTSGLWSGLLALAGLPAQPPPSTWQRPKRIASRCPTRGIWYISLPVVPWVAHRTSASPLSRS